jgi:hypothetical protein
MYMRVVDCSALQSRQITWILGIGALVYGLLPTCHFNKVENVLFMERQLLPKGTIPTSHNILEVYVIYCTWSLI